MPVFVVTGARGGIGLEYVRQLSTSPANTTFALVRDTSVDIRTLTDIKAHSPGTSFILECDISSDTSVQEMGKVIALHLAKTNQRIDTIINNAAILDCADETSLSLQMENLFRHVNSNLGGPLRVTQILLPYLKPDGVIANITSGMGSLGMLSQRRIVPSIPCYSISKAGLNMLTVHQAYELKGRAIVVSVDPGHVKTDKGGSKATLEIHDSARQVLSSIARLEPSDSGKFILYNGQEMPW